LTWILLSIGLRSVLFLACAWLVGFSAYKMRGAWVSIVAFASVGFALLWMSWLASFFLVLPSARQMEQFPQFTLHLQSLLATCGCLALFFSTWKTVQTMRRWEDRNPFQVEDLRARLDEAFLDLEDS